MAVPGDDDDDPSGVAGGAPRRSGPRVLALGALWIGLVLLHLQPTPRSIRSTLPNDLGDPSFTLAILRWGAEAIVRRPLEVFDAPFYWPADQTLGFSDTFLSLAPAHGIVSWATGSAVAGFNLLTLGLYLLSLVSTYLLGRWLFGRTDVAVVMAATFTFTSYSLGQQSHLQVLTFGLLPLGILALLRFLDRGRWGDAALVGVVTLGILYGSVYYTLLWALVAPGLVVALLLLGHRPAAPVLRRGVVAAAVTAVLALPAVALHASVSSGHGVVRSYDQIDTLLWGDFLTPAAGNWFWNDTFHGINSIDQPGDHGFMVGLLVYAAAAAGIVLLIRARRAPVLAASSDGGDARSGWVRRVDAVWAILAVGLGSLLVGLGPEAFGRVSPYRVLYRFVPGFDGIRSSSRLAVLVLLALAVLAAVAVGRLADLARRHTRSETAAVGVVAVLLAGMMIEVLAVGRLRVDAWDPPGVLEVYEAVEARPDGAVLELPIEFPPTGFAWPFVESPRMALYVTDEDHPRINGYSGHWPQGWVETVAVLREFPDRRALDHLAEVEARYVVLHTTSPWASSDPLAPDEVDRILAELPPGATAEQFDGAWLIDLRPGGPRATD